jgi:hypothetical protein
VALEKDFDSPSTMSETDALRLSEYASLVQTLESTAPSNDGCFADFDEFVAFTVASSNEGSTLKAFLKSDWINPVRNDYQQSKVYKKMLIPG